MNMDIVILNSFHLRESTQDKGRMAVAQSKIMMGHVPINGCQGLFGSGSVVEYRSDDPEFWRAPSSLII